MFKNIYIIVRCLRKEKKDKREFLHNVEIQLYQTLRGVTPPFGTLSFLNLSVKLEIVVRLNTKMISALQVGVLFHCRNRHWRKTISSTFAFQDTFKLFPK